MINTTAYYSIYNFFFGSPPIKLTIAIFVYVSITFWNITPD